MGDRSTDDAAHVALVIASNEYQRRVQQAHSAVTRVDQTPIILGTGLSLILTAWVASLAVLLPQPNGRFWIASAILALAGGTLTVLVLYRDFVSRIGLTDAEKAQSRLRRYFVDRAPEIELYLSDSTYDDWPTPFNNPRGSKTFAAWVVLAAIAAILYGLASAAATLAISIYQVLASTLVGGVTTVISGSILITGLIRLAGRQARRDVPIFPRVPQLGTDPQLPATGLRANTSTD